MLDMQNRNNTVYGINVHSSKNEISKDQIFLCVYDKG